MSRKRENEWIVGLDIGTSKVVAIVGEMGAKNQVEVIGLGTHPTRGISRGVVVDIESATHSIQRAVEEAELMADCRIESVTASIGGSHIGSMNSEGMCPIKDRKEVSKEDVIRVMEAANAVNLPAGQHRLHTEPRHYIIDGQAGIQHPVGMSGVRLVVDAHLVTCAESAMQNVRKCVTRAGLELDNLVAQPLASAASALNEDEKELGVCLLDIGAGTTDISIYSRGAVRYTGVLPIAGEAVTNDIAITLRTPTQAAEEIKKKYACALVALAHQNETIEVPSVGNRPSRKMDRQALAGVIQPRYEEIFSMVASRMRAEGLEEMVAAGIVLTGGAAKMEGVVELAEEYFHMPVRLGAPQGVTGLSEVVSNPIHAAGVGLLLWDGEENNFSGAAGLESGTWIDRLKLWLRGDY
ncbi:MAG: cell division protein FtsA [bacterium]